MIEFFVSLKRSKKVTNSIGWQVYQFLKLKPSQILENHQEAIGWTDWSCLVYAIGSMEWRRTTLANSYHPESEENKNFSGHDISATGKANTLKSRSILVIRTHPVFLMGNFHQKVLDVIIFAQNFICRYHTFWDLGFYNPKRIPLVAPQKGQAWRNCMYMYIYICI